MISDQATIAYLGDVLVLAEYRGRGLAKWLMECIASHADLQGLRRWILVTEDAHGLYRKYEFTQLAHPEGFMEPHNPDVYKPAGSRPGHTNPAAFERIPQKMGASMNAVP